MKIEFYFDFTCPYAYIASTAIEAIAAEFAAELCWRPMLLGGVFRAGGADNSPMETMGPAKAHHNLLDMHRWAEALGVTLRMPGAHPMRSVRALRALLVLPESARPPVIHEFYRAYWQRGDDITTAATVRQVLVRAGVRGPILNTAVAANDDSAIKVALRARTDEAVARGVFGAPSMFVHVPGRDQPYLFWGQDRLHFVRAVLSGWRPEGETDRQTKSETTGQTKSETTGGAQIRDVPGLDPVATRFTQLAANEPASHAPRAAKKLHFWFDFSSPFAYLGATQAQAVADRTGAELIWHPMLLGGLFRQIHTANVPLFTMAPAKRDYIARDLDTWAAYWQIPFTYANRFPQRTVTALRLVLLAGDRIAELAMALFRVMWVHDGNLEDEATLEAVLHDLGFDAREMLRRTKDPAVKQALFDNTAAAARAGVFGTPAWVVEDQRNDLLGALLFWGQDRLELVEAALRGWRPHADDTLRLALK